ncbi:hypothetical protein ONA24_06750 [Mycoplasmopsis cynos]|uniref:hypothetical protein n=1 Tax=Mycoplasmopsis cynos TaxID=171284 RepID=UPI0024CDE953|nr:hypothetical protein [Mycoplasmopsis cynos]WAM09639.1 hypothetical protein ONA24_06750 [Mycoplasmopsis cynos]
MKKVSNNNVSAKPDTLDSKQDLNDVLSSRKDQLKIDQETLETKIPNDSEIIKVFEFVHSDQEKIIVSEFNDKESHLQQHCIKNSNEINNSFISEKEFYTRK